jgi:hypothetical protein
MTRIATRRSLSRAKSKKRLRQGSQLRRERWLSATNAKLFWQAFAQGFAEEYRSPTADDVASAVAVGAMVGFFVVLVLVLALWIGASH